MRSNSCIFLWLFAAFLALSPLHAAAESATPRVVIALYDSRMSRDISSSLLLSVAEMPLNHLGLVLEYHDVNQPLPDLSHRPDVRGIITWYIDDLKIPDIRGYLNWAERAVDSGKKFVILGKLGFYYDPVKKVRLPKEVINHFLNKIGLDLLDQRVNVTPEVTYDYRTPSMFVIHEPFKLHKPPYEKIAIIDRAVTAHLVAREGGADTANRDGVLIATGPHGGYIAEDYLYRANVTTDDEIRQWYVDPFLFFRLAFATDDLPKPDTTTIAGRRIYYSHIDGDGWNNYTRVEDYKDRPAISAQVLMEKVFMPHPDLPVSVTVIAADVDPNWVGSDYSRDVAKAIFALPQVEAGTHTYSHPFDWSFFTGNDIDERESKYLQRYRFGSWDTADNILEKITPSVFSGQSTTEGDAKLATGYQIPRAYANERFNLHKEIQGSVDEISTLLPPGKKVKLLTWPGDCLPFEEAVRLSREAGLANINGGDSRFDPEYPSYAMVAPLGRPVGKERQIYASTSNENTYTYDWKRRFYSHQYLRYTLDNTETPVRVSPLNIYYHIFVGERTASLNALLKNIDYAERHEIAPITTSHYSNIAQGFYTAQLIPEGASEWRVRDRGELNTLRFDNAAQRTVDFTRSSGVIGQRHYQGSLYVYLDAVAHEPVIALTSRGGDPDYEADASTPYLIESRWPLSNVKIKGSGFSFTAQGYGKGEMTWQVPSFGHYVLHLPGGATQRLESDDTLLTFTISDDAAQPREYSISRE